MLNNDKDSVVTRKGKEEAYLQRFGFVINNAGKIILVHCIGRIPQFKLQTLGNYFKEFISRKVFFPDLIDFAEIHTRKK